MDMQYVNSLEIKVTELEAKLEKAMNVVEAVQKLRINSEPFMSGYCRYSVNVSNANSKALGEITGALYEFQSWKEMYDV